ncbi:MAG: hypothetical protein JNK56_12770 [Myxococcales bacterium]|nr:hypothetical protein [Myxococcales bacterium]
MRRIANLAVPALLACNGTGPSASTFGGGPTEAPATTTGSTGSANSSSSAADSGSSTSGHSSTTAAQDSSTGQTLPPDFGPIAPQGCQGKIDFLFVISNSGGMTNVQDQVHAALPDFITSIEDSFGEFDSHIMVVDTDAGWLMKDCSLCGPGCDPDGQLPLCGAKLDACDATMGAGVVFPAGKDSSARRCDLAAGRYITRDDPDPIAAFLCTAKVGSGGGIDTPADAMVAALSWPLLGTHGYPTGCNQGFLRDDALLVVTIIADGADSYSSGPAEAWLKALMDAKNQDGDAFQLLVITTDHDIVGGICGVYEGFVNRLRTFVNIVPHGRIGSICAESYGPFFDLAIADVLERCDSFIPQ